MRAAFGTRLLVFAHLVIALGLPAAMPESGLSPDLAPLLRATADTSAAPAAPAAPAGAAGEAGAPDASPAMNTPSPATDSVDLASTAERADAGAPPGASGNAAAEDASAAPEPEEDLLAAIAGSSGPSPEVASDASTAGAAQVAAIPTPAAPAAPAAPPAPAVRTTVRRTALGLRINRGELEINLAQPEFLEIRWLARDGRVLGLSSGRFPEGRSAVGLARPKGAGPLVLEVRGAKVTRRFPIPG